MTSLQTGEYEKRKTLADGTVKVYRYNRKAPAKLEQRPDGEIIPDTSSASCWASVKTEYLRSPEFKKLAAGTRKWYRRMLELTNKFGPKDVTEIKRRDALIVRNSMSDTPGKANNFISAMQAVMAWAVYYEYMEVSPLIRIERLPTGTFEPFTEAQLAFAMRTLIEPHRRGMVLSLYTGQRASDCVKMTWADYDGSGIKVRQQKTKNRKNATELWIPAHPELRYELNRWRAEATEATILVHSGGKPWTSARSFCASLCTAMRKHPELDSLDPDKRDAVFHGLRKLAAVRLAEAGCSVHEIMSITGHATLQMVEHYTQGANQKRLAQSAMLRLVGEGAD